ncbi:hypothetical protein AYO21_07908 [Fonsecaea monophora]|uniref:Uncharacterized protein n=1 Tax=Fonsecaea monophora TaxID=254056 RepID=A0A177F290_9EURO|nr:hypothetical protein AYO21_07908 [Fonsecaea monophora]KAH0846722.1 hypothetical protein FOPE_11818 [Fonsecaea pedrosoi]OAG37936.1 hypothetical protein AYO21_07908 [Fonsecaea monophora]
MSSILKKLKGKGTAIPIQQAPAVPSGSTASSLAPTARPLVSNPQAPIVVVLIHGLNSSESAFIGANGTSWATELNQLLEPLINKTVEVVEVGWQTTPLSPANVSLNISSTAPELLDAVASQVRGRDWVAVGHSMGGMEILAAMGIAFAEVSGQAANPRTAVTQRSQQWGTLLDSCLGIFRLASPGQGSPWGQPGVILAGLIPHATGAQIRGLQIDSTESRAITDSSDQWFRYRLTKNKPVNVFSAQETEPVVPGTPKIVDYDGSAFSVSSTRLTNSKTVLLPGESHTSAPKAQPGTHTADILVAGVAFCIDGKVPPGIELTPGRDKPSGLAGKVSRILPLASTLKRRLPGGSGGRGAGGSGGGAAPTS